MHQRLVASLAVVVVTGLVAPGGSGRTDSSSAKTSTTTRAATASSAASTTTTTTAPDLAAVNLKLTKVTELQRPTAMAIRPGDQTLYVAEKVGRIRAVRSGGLDPNPVLDITSLVNSSGNEQGLLGLAFLTHRSQVYVHY